MPWRRSVRNPDDEQEGAHVSGQREGVSPAMLATRGKIGVLPWDALPYVLPMKGRPLKTLAATDTIVMELVKPRTIKGGRLWPKIAGRKGMQARLTTKIP